MDADTRHRYCALAETIADSMERALKYDEDGLLEAVANLRAWIYDSFRHSAFMREWLREHRSWYFESLTSILDEVDQQVTTSPKSK